MAELNSNVGPRTLNPLVEQLDWIASNVRAAQPQVLRPWTREHLIPEKTRGVLISGQRGVGKTTLLLASTQRKALYFSADNPLVSAHSLSDLGAAAFAVGFEGLLIDEVHHARDWSVQIKSLYDSHPRKFIWASDSSSLILREGAFDLSRRLPRLEMPLLSFREYLALVGAGDYPTLPLGVPSLKDIKPLLDRTSLLADFVRYRREGMRPFFLEGFYAPKVLATLEKSIYHDVPFFVPQIHENHLGLMNAVVGLLATSPVPTVNVESLCRDWSVGKEKAYALLNALEYIGVLNIVGVAGRPRVGKGAKLLLADPSLYACLGGNFGTAREAYVVTMLKGAGHAVFASKDESQGDFEVAGLTVEVGGAGKKRKKSDFVIRDDVETPSRSVIPMWCLGFLY
jgi:predicted AAA+ superfamily ATPase